MIKSLGVFCGSSIGNKDTFRQAAEKLGKLLSLEGIIMIYGGGNIGMMGAIADSMLAENGRVIGVIPEGIIKKEIAHTGIEKMHIVKDLSERKYVINQLSDAFVALPGGFGTLDELFEMVTLMQLGEIEKPIAMLNTDHYFDPLMAMMDQAVKNQFVKSSHRKNIISSASPEELMAKLRDFQPELNDEKWIERLKEQNRYV